MAFILVPTIQECSKINLPVWNHRETIFEAVSRFFVPGSWAGREPNKGSLRSTNQLQSTARNIVVFLAVSFGLDGCLNHFRLESTHKFQKTVAWRLPCGVLVVREQLEVKTLNTLGKHHSFLTNKNSTSVGYGQNDNGKTFNFGVSWRGCFVFVHNWLFYFCPFLVRGNRYNFRK